MSDDEITLTATEFKVSVTEKRSTGEYENVQPHASLEGELETELAGENRARVRRQLLAIQRDLQAVVEQAADNRVSIEEHEDWSDPLSDTDE